MFTNWLTGTGSSTASSNLPSRSHGSETHNGLSALTNINGLHNLNANMISTPPDVILEVGPRPQTIRFMAHSIVLGMHSGYLRSAIRMDERVNGNEFIVYLTNVTAEQFAPLLSYMYTGYLELNVENIFGVLLATHVLHMPRALEICRSYLARSQSEGFLSSHNNAAIHHPSSLSTSNASNSHSLPTSSGKIIRPIASKPQMPNFGFLPMAHSMNMPTLADNRAMSLTSMNSIKGSPSYKTESIKDDEDVIEVDEVEKQSVIGDTKLTAPNEDDDEDIEVFIDTNSEAEVVIETDIPKLGVNKSLDSKKSLGKDSSSSHSKLKHDKSQKKSSHRSEKHRRRAGTSAHTSSSGLQVAKAPIPASQLDTSEANKVIIDVASCDGPVRFKRILNAAYGHKSDTCIASNNTASGSGIQERTLQSVSLSFHQQMAKAISQQQQVIHNGEESENSETSNGSAGGGGGGKSGRKPQSEVFVCVYCKHTFKSQYCYQKHAKRHLNPLTLQATCVPSTSTEKRTISEDKVAVAPTETPGKGKSQNLQSARPFFIRNSDNQMQTNQITSNGPLHTSSDYLRREVRPLDMNVQYYPCKTCGCKFPSYYFVHKHRKMCHADEEAQQQSNASSSTVAASPSVPSDDHVEAVYSDKKEDDSVV